jgi:carboxyl-terminal processing protease
MNKTLFIFILYAFTNLASAQDFRFCDELKAIVSTVEQAHYKPKPLNDSLSASVFKLFLNTIDDNQNFFLESDIEEFSEDIYAFDDYINSGDCNFISKYAERLQKRIEETENILKNFKTSTLDYTKKDSLYYFDDDQERYFADEKSRENYWSKNIKFKILRKLAEKSDNFDKLKSIFASLEGDIKSRVLENELCLLNEKQQQNISLHNWVETAFLNAYLHYQDPNSTYFSSSSKTIFENSLNNTTYSFGIKTKKGSNGEISIAYIVPGSSAFKHADIDEEDKIISLSSDNETLEAYCVSSETVENFINDSAHKELDFKIKKRNGQVKTVRLKKTKVNNDVNSTTGYIIEKERPIGYIEIPSFYTDMESFNGLGVANDVAKQIYKLQKENIEALIIDLRYNGGGSMQEAADLAGMFIDRGPVAITAHRAPENYTMRDPNRGLIFYKPVVVLVSQFSASASELFAGVLQDYNSGIIVGSSTHGKATSQRLLPLKNTEDTNFVKLTVGEFFRVNGISHQKTGIIPDVILPSIYDQLETQETFRPFALPTGTTEVTLKHRPNLPLPLSIIKQKSKNRLKSDSTFQRLSEINKTFVEKYIKKEGVYPLTLKYVFEDLKQYESLWKDYENLFSSSRDLYKVKNTTSTQNIISYNEDEKEANKINRQEISKDPYIREAVNIALDIIKTN